MTEMLPFFLLSMLLSANAVHGLVTYSVPTSPPANSSQTLDPSPVGISVEFFAFPGYFKSVPSTQKCLGNLQALSGAWPPIRIGGTTQDRATYNASSSSDVTYSVSSPADAPQTLTFGPSFMDLANTYRGQVILGLNRRLNNISNTIAAAKQAVKKVQNLNAIELGNEPNFYCSSDPIAQGSWNAAKDAQSQKSWQASIGANLTRTDFVSAGVFFGTGSFNVQELTAVENTSTAYVKDYCSHNYPQSGSTANLSQLMSHSAIHAQIAPFKNEIAAAKNSGKYHIMGETNSATQGGGGISPTFGAALWVMDYSLQLLLLGSRALYFHQGTIGNCQYCWWGRYSMGAPYYGAYLAAMALAGSESLAPLDDFSSTSAGYVFFSSNMAKKVLLYNSEYYVSGTRPAQSFVLQGLTGQNLTAYRLTAPSATSRQDQGGNPTISGMSFENGTCNMVGTSVPEHVHVANGKATVSVAASEALLLFL